MGSVVPTGYGLATLEYDVPGHSGQVVNVLGLNLIDYDESDTISQWIGDTWVSYVMPELNSNCTLLGVAVTRNIGGVFFEDSYIYGEPGGITGDCLPPNVTYLIRKVGGVAGRQNRGRLYLPGVDSGDVSNAGIVGDTTFDALQTAITDAAFQLAEHGIVFAIMHDEDGPYAATAPRDVQSFAMQRKVATQRQRLRD